MIVGLAAAALVLTAQDAAVQDVDAGVDDSYVFWSQPAVSRVQALADFDDCRDLASSVRPPASGYMYAPNPIAAGVNGLFQGLQRGAQRRHLFDAALRKCLFVKGYARYAMGRDEAKTLYGGGWTQLREKLADRALAPVGPAARLGW